MPVVDTSRLDVVERLPGWHGRYFHSASMTFAHYDFVRGAAVYQHFTPQESSVWRPPKACPSTNLSIPGAFNDWDGLPSAQCKPPAVWMIWPVIQPASGDARNETTVAMSRGWPTRPSGVRGTICALN